MKSRGIFFFIFCLVVLAGGLLLHSQDQKSVLPIGKPVQIKAPLGLPPVPIPPDNPLTAETIALGRRLYYDPILSSDGFLCVLPQSAVWICRSQARFRRCR